jgi:S-adenosylmethionine uptake transporter
MSGLRPATHGPGILLYLVGVFFFAVNDALGKWLVADYGVGQLMLLRNIGAAFVLIPIIAALRINLLDFSHPWLQFVRILCMAADTFCFYFATRSMPLADVMTFYMAAPLIVTALSAPLLGEKVEPFRWMAIAIGFAGVLIALQPSPALLSSASPIALIGAAMFGLGEMATRRLRAMHWLPLVGWQFAGAGLIGGATIPWSWVAPNPFDLALMFVVGIVAMLCFICITRSLSLAPVAVVAPFQYTSIVWATIIGWIVWHDKPTLPIIIGNCIIIGSGLFVFYREFATEVAPARIVAP